MSAQDFGDELAELFKTAEASSEEAKPETSETLETSKPAQEEPKARPRRRASEPAASSVDVEEIRRQVTEEVTAGMASQLAALQEQLTRLQQQPIPVHGQVAPLLPATSPFDPPKPEITTENSILIHFVDDGFTVGSQVFYRGQELRVLKEEGWAHLSGREQVRKFRKVYFRQGPWDGDGFDLTDPSLTDAERAKLMKVMESSPA